MGDITGKLIRVAARASGLNHLLRRQRFPGLAFGSRVHLDVFGTLGFGPGCAISEGANILVPQGASLELGAQVFVGRYVEIGPGGRIVIGDDTSLQDRVIVIGDVFIGRHCLVSLNVLMSSGRHYYDLVPQWLIRDQDRRALLDAGLQAAHSRPIRIDDDCWIGVNSVVMPGVTIGRGVVVGAGSIVTRDVPPYAVVAGSPARIIKRRLEFAPPRRIQSTDVADRPYFYAGFDHTQHALGEESATGLMARERFELRLDTRNARSLQVRVHADVACSLQLGTQRRIIGGYLETVRFDLGDPESLPGIQVEIAPSSARVRVTEAWVE